MVHTAAEHCLGEGGGGGDGLLANWNLPEVIAQQEFFERKVLPVFDGTLKRAFVLISDAFRFEVAHELTQQINGKNRFKASLDAMLGVLPSYTALGKGTASGDIVSSYERTMMDRGRAVLSALYHGYFCYAGQSNRRYSLKGLLGFERNGNLPCFGFRLDSNEISLRRYAYGGDMQDNPATTD